jgi:hypothetical protein
MLINWLLIGVSGALSSWDDALYLLEGKRVMLGMFAVHLVIGESG